MTKPEEVLQVFREIDSSNTLWHIEQSRERLARAHDLIRGRADEEDDVDLKGLMLEAVGHLSTALYHLGRYDGSVEAYEEESHE